MLVAVLVFRCGCLGPTNNNTKPTNNNKQTNKHALVCFIVFSIAGNMCYLLCSLFVCVVSVCKFFVYQQQHRTNIEQAKQNKQIQTEQQKQTQHRMVVFASCLLRVCVVVVLRLVFHLFVFCLPRSGYTSRTEFVVNVCFSCVCWFCVVFFVS